MEEDEAESDDTADYYGGIMKSKSEKGNATILFIIRGFLILLLNAIFYVVIIFGTVEICKISYSFANEVFGDVVADPPPGQDRTFLIEEADDSLTIAKNLEQTGIVPNAYSFYIRLRLTQNEKNIIVAGSYELNTSMTYEEILERIVKGVSA